MTSCFFTGHRKINISDDLTKRLTETITRLIQNGVTDFYAGGAVGFDTLCEKTVLSLKIDFPQIKLHLILPCSPKEQCKMWTQAQKDDYYNIIKLADSVELTSHSYVNGCMKKRNTRLTELGEICICYWNGGNRSGTSQTVNMAAKKGIKIVNLYNKRKPGT